MPREEIEALRANVVLLERAAQLAASETRAAVARAERAEQQCAELAAENACRRDDARLAEAEREKSAVMPSETLAESIVDMVHDTLWSAEHRGEGVVEMARRVKAQRDSAWAAIKEWHAAGHAPRGPDESAAELRRWVVALARLAEIATEVADAAR